jgi:ABC-type Fe3+-hydroxamate transport system substrate-binding protein
MNLIKLFILFLFIVLAFLITACSTAVPVTQNFPTAPEMLIEKCPELKTIQGEKVSIVDFTRVVSENYTTYYQCAGRTEAWIDWYKQQKKIWDDVK